ncbi:hypothetical protein GGX14DRAFT_585061 [Mycena pura]|uniref:Ubiquitin 3 binding protein But2 C-terminal domain-containing protein n=1 Tax=Mycena pura TaxID=153505 RepID=A0AAD6YG91_9AGAR|nr:hypothetical protein GGX14DRAFT_585061 [Mycena pura]
MVNVNQPRPPSPLSQSESAWEPTLGDEYREPALSPDSEGEYTSLLQHDDAPAAKELDSCTPSRSASTLDRLVRIATVIIVCCTVIDMILILYLGIQRQTTGTNARPNEDDLEIRSPYVNLAELYSQTPLESSKHDPIVNHARAFVQISSTEPNRIFPPYGLMRPIADGMVPEYERRLLATPTISTIAQFRVADFGMELCSLSITVPPRNSSGDHIMNTASVDIWSLPVTKKLNMQKLSYSTRPLGGTFFGSLPVSFNKTTRLPAYPCLSGTYQTFEFRCSKPECSIDITGQGDEASGLYIYQYQTI